MNIQKIQKNLEWLADLLNKIRKTLAEYMEGEHFSFTQFYFVGDDNLLQIIGNSKDILHIMKHLKRMFAGIPTIMLNDNRANSGYDFKRRRRSHIHGRHPLKRLSQNQWLAHKDCKLPLQFYFQKQLESSRLFMPRTLTLTWESLLLGWKNTTNPSYAGHSQLPPNETKLFRPWAHFLYNVFSDFDQITECRWCVLTESWFFNSCCSRKVSVLLKLWHQK